MQRRAFAAAVTLAPLAGCARFTEEENGQVSVTVRNHGETDVTFELVVEADDDTRYEHETDTLQPDTTRGFEVPVGSSGRHVARVTGDDFAGELAWNVDDCRSYDAQFTVSAELVSTEGECLERR